MCHVAAWLLDHNRKPPHGPVFWKWASIAFQKVGVEVTTCHNYEIHRPFKFQCTSSECGKIYTRNSKKGIDVNR